MPLKRLWRGQSAGRMEIIFRNKEATTEAVRTLCSNCALHGLLKQSLSDLRSTRKHTTWKQRILAPGI